MNTAILIKYKIINNPDYKWLNVNLLELLEHHQLLGQPVVCLWWLISSTAKAEYFWTRKYFAACQSEYTKFFNLCLIHWHTDSLSPPWGMQMSKDKLFVLEIVISAVGLQNIAEMMMGTFFRNDFKMTHKILQIYWLTYFFIINFFVTLTHYLICILSCRYNKVVTTTKNNNGCGRITKWCCGTGRSTN